MIREVIALPMSSRVWVYQGDREFSYEEIDEIRPRLYDFADAWESHGKEVQSYANIFHKRFIVFMADETGHGVSGCSTDSSVKMVQEIGKMVNADFFNRWLFVYMDDAEDIHSLSKEGFQEAYKTGVINEETLIFDPLVKNKEQFIKHWLVPLKDSWQKQFVES